MSIRNIDQLDAIIGPMLSAGRIPGAAIAVVAGDEIAFARGYGYRDLETKLPVTPDTVYPIASTTKAINATMLGILVDEGRLAWDAPVQHYLPRFRIGDSLMSSQITVRDLLLMRTGLPRHDWFMDRESDQPRGTRRATSLPGPDSGPPRTLSVQQYDAHRSGARCRDC